MRDTPPLTLLLLPVVCTFLAGAFIAGCNLSAGNPSDNLNPSSSVKNRHGYTGISLPDAVLGAYHSTLMLSGTAGVEGHQNVKAYVSQNKNKVSIVFSEGVPVLTPAAPAINNFLFEVVPGSQAGVYQSVKPDQSAAGIVISSYVTNMNIDVPVGGIKIIYTCLK